MSGNPVSFCRTFLDKNLFLHDGNTFWNTVDGVTFTTPAKPATGSWVPGAVWLNNYVYVGNSTNNLIYSCNSGDPTNWSSTSNIAFYMTTDTLVALAKHLNYVVAFGTKSLQFYYDAGTGNGTTVSSLATAGSYTSEVGCWAPRSISSTDNITTWVSWSAAQGLGVHMLDGTTPVKISTPSIDKVLEVWFDSTFTFGYTYKFDGHTCYVVTNPINQFTLVYDYSTQRWCQWTSVQSGVEREFLGSFFAQSNTQARSYVQEYFTADLYQLATYEYKDNGQLIKVKGITELIDMGSTKMKFFRRAEIVGDLNPATTIQLSYTNDDYNTFTTPRTIPQAVGNRPAVYQLGQARRRGWQMLHQDNTPLRLNSIEIDFDIGELE
jgi:hypothetical protein